jgi:uncharacterized phage-associated protein
MDSEAFKYKSTDVAEYLLYRASEDGIVMNMTKLQKLLYISYGIYLSVKDARLSNEHPQAWPYGPVFPTTRNKFLKVSFDDPQYDKNKEIYKDTDMISLADLVFSVFGSWTAGQLTEWSHAEGTPWESTKCTPGFKWGHVIPDDSIKQYFSTILVKNEEHKDK